MPFRNLSPWFGMILISLLTGLMMLLIFRFASNQEGIRKVKDKIKAHLLELRLFKDSLRLTLKAQGKILRYNLKYLSYSVKPLLIMIIPLVLILFQLNLWFGYQSLKTGEETILKVKLKEYQNPLDFDIAIEASQALIIDTPPLRIEDENEINWRLKAREKGLHILNFEINDQKFTKKVSVAQRSFTKISPLKVSRNFIDEMYNPGEAPLPGALPVKAVEVMYPSKNMDLFGWRIHWLIVYFALSIIFGFVLKGIFRVEI
ncbi:MAG: hypothetical protein ACETWK_14090 [Candidatus Aminicenantaceae bacterium]